VSETHHDNSLRSRTVAGAVAGNLTVAGIKTTDVLKVVHLVSAAGPNLVAEFTITAADTINNTGGTSTAGGVVLVQWYAADPRGGSMNRK
jgi:adhesin HecA-like repeat protein